MSTPKVGDEGWSWRGSDLYPCKILEVNTDYRGQTRYFVSYYSPAVGRRSVTIVLPCDLVKVPVKVVSYQLMTVTRCGVVEKQAEVKNTNISFHWKPQEGYDKTFIQRTEVTGDNIEVFVEKVL